EQVAVDVVVDVEAELHLRLDRLQRLAFPSVVVADHESASHRDRVLVQWLVRARCELRAVGIHRSERGREPVRLRLAVALPPRLGAAMENGTEAQRLCRRYRPVSETVCVVVVAEAREGGLHLALRDHPITSAERQTSLSSPGARRANSSGVRSRETATRTDRPSAAR